MCTMTAYRKKYPKSTESKREVFLEEVIFELTLEEGLGVYCGSKGEEKRMGDNRVSDGQKRQCRYMDQYE